MNKFIIYLIDDFISVYGFETEPIPLKKEGEEKFKYSSDFWEWFQEKIDYNNEELSFIVVTNREDFAISKKIKLAETSSFKEIPLGLQQYKDTKIKTFPELEKIKKSVILKTVKEKTFADYFVSKTSCLKF